MSSVLTSRLELSILGDFCLRHRADQVTLAQGSQRLLAFLALQGGTAKRMVVAGALWPEATEGRAHGCLRTSLARLRGIGRQALLVSATDLRLASDVGVDLLESRALAHHVLDPLSQLEDRHLNAAAVSTLSKDLLPDWYDDWIVLEAESWRQLRLHALETLAARLTSLCRYGEAATAAYAAVKADPLRESAHACLIRIHLAEHNLSEALREFWRCRELLQAELGLEPSAQLRQLLPLAPA